jgi:thymidylate kinase
MSQAQLQLLREVYGHLPLVRPSVVLFLDAPPDVCLARIAQRGRACEAGVTLDYLQRLHAHYLTFLAESANFCSVRHVDCSQADAEAVADRVEECLTGLV